MALPLRRAESIKLAEIRIPRIAPATALPQRHFRFRQPFRLLNPNSLSPTVSCLTHCRQFQVIRVIKVQPQISAVNITGNVDQGDTFNVTVNGRSFSYTASAGDVSDPSPVVRQQAIAAAVETSFPTCSGRSGAVADAVLSPAPPSRCVCKAICFPKVSCVALPIASRSM